MLQALPERHLNEALADFVDKEEAKAFENLVENSIKTIRELVLGKVQKGEIPMEISVDTVRALAEERVKVSKFMF